MKQIEVLTNCPQEQLLEAAKTKLTSAANKLILSEMMRALENTVSLSNNFY